MPYQIKAIIAHNSGNGFNYIKEQTPEFQSHAKNKETECHVTNNLKIK